MTEQDHWKEFAKEKVAVFSTSNAAKAYWKAQIPIVKIKDLCEALLLEEKKAHQSQKYYSREYNKKRDWKQWDKDYEWNQIWYKCGCRDLAKKIRMELET